MIAYIVGTMKSTSSVEMVSPNTMLVVNGMSICACGLDSRSSGHMPTIVVAEVSRTARNRSFEALHAACVSGIPVACSSFANSTRMMLSFTTMPASDASLTCPQLLDQVL